MMQPEKVYRTNLHPLSFLQRAAHIFPGRTAVVHGDRRYSYREFEQRVLQLAAQLRSAGLQKHDRVAFLCPNIPPLLEAHYGVPAAGGILVAINTRLDADEINYILGHSGAKWLFVDAELERRLATCNLSGMQVVRIDDTGTTGDPYEDFLASGRLQEVASWLDDEEETISINYTSGTTGRPKGVMYTYRGAYLNALSQVIEAELTDESVYLWTLPMFHCNGWCFTWAVTAVGATHVCLRRIETSLIWRLIDDEQVTHYCGAPTLQIMLMNHPDARRLVRPVTVCVAGAPPSPTLLEQLGSRNFRAIHVYGLTETYGPMTRCCVHPEWSECTPQQQASLRARQGQAQVAADLVRVVDSAMQDVPRDGQTLGEVVMRGNIVMKGYYQDETATAAAFSGGWFHSGDLGVWHEDGAIELRDRKKDIIISGGENISTIEVEQAVARHPAVLECAVIAIPHAQWGERPKAFVTLKPGHTATESDIINFCRQCLSHFKCPDAIEFGELPKTSTGKVQKFVLREQEWAGHDKRIN